MKGLTPSQPNDYTVIPKLRSILKIRRLLAAVHTQHLYDESEALRNPIPPIVIVEGSIRKWPSMKSKNSDTSAETTPGRHSHPRTTR